MDCLTQGNKLLQIKKELLSFFKEIRGKVNDVSAALTNYLEDPELQSEIGKIRVKYNLTVDEIRDFIQDKGEILDIFGMKLIDLKRGNKINLGIPFKTIERKDKEASVSLNLAANAKLELDCDDDGSLADDLATFNKNKEVILSACLSGELGIKLEQKARKEELANKLKCENHLAAKTGIRIYNYFIHDKDVLLLDALLEDIPEIDLPGEVAKRPEIINKNQLIHIHNSNGINLSGALSWSNSFIKTLHPASFVTSAITTFLTPSVDFEFKWITHNSSNILISRENSKMLKVKIGLEETNGREAGVKLGLSAGVNGLDDYVICLLDQFSAPLTTLVGEVSNYKQKYSNVDKLLTTAVEEQLDDFFTDSDIVKEIEDWLAKIAGKEDIVKTLQKYLKETAVDTAGSFTRHLQNNAIDPACKMFEKFIRIYQSTFSKLKELVREALEIKLGISITRKVKAMEKEGVSWEFDINVNQNPDAFRQLIAGDFALTLEKSFISGSGIRTIKGIKYRDGLRQITTGLDISLLGIDFSQQSVFTQEWESEVSNNGDIIIGIQTELKNIYKDWRNARSSTLLLDSRLPGRVNIDAAKQIRFENKFSYEIAVHDDNPTKDEIKELEVKMRDLGVLTNSSNIAPSLIYDKGKKKPFGPMDCSAVLRFRPADLLKPTSTDNMILLGALGNTYLQGQFEYHLLLEFAINRLLIVNNPLVRSIFSPDVKLKNPTEKKLILLSKKLKDWYKGKIGKTIDENTPLVFPINGKSYSLTGAAPSVYIAMRHVDFFDRFLKSVAKFQDLAFTNADVDIILDAMKRAHAEVIADFGDVLKGGEKLIYEIFRSILNLMVWIDNKNLEDAKKAKAAENGIADYTTIDETELIDIEKVAFDPCLVVKRRRDKKRFIFN